MRYVRWIAHDQVKTLVRRQGVQEIALHKANPIRYLVARGIVSSWFVLCGTPTLQTMRAGDLTYLPEGRGAAAALRALRERGCEINLHGSFVTSERHEVFAEQRHRLAGLVQQPVLGVRQHFLRLRPGITSLGMAGAGFRYDTSWGFPDRNGFRLGVGDVIPAWDGAGERALELQEAPVIWMDRALSKYARVEDPNAWIAALPDPLVPRRRGGVLDLTRRRIPGSLHSPLRRTGQCRCPSRSTRRVSKATLTRSWTPSGSCCRERRHPESSTQSAS